MLSLAIQGIKQVEAKLAHAKAQIPFATANALNKTALAVQEYEITREIPDHLKLRTNWWKPRYKFGVNIKFAKKRDLRATVNSRAPWLAAVDVGGTKRPQRGRAIAIPTDRINQTRKRRTRELPEILIASKRAFSISVNGHRGIFRRVGKKARRLEALYFYHPSPKIPDLTNFYESGQKVVDRVYKKIFDIELANAIRTAK